MKNLLPGREGTVGMTDRGIATRYAQRAINFLGSIYLAASVVELN